MRLSAAGVRRVSWILMAVVFVVALGYGATDDGGQESDQERASRLAASIACPQCQGQPVGESNAPIAEEIRTQIKQQVDDGLTDDQIVAFYVTRYGDWVDLNPSRSGLTGVVWIAPFLVIGLAAGALALAFSRWRADMEPARASDEDRSIVEAARRERTEDAS